ncbi:LytTR family DNA-binding domain-containing protein [Sedimentibacter sp.]|uniref:LytTR family DNA-binding domain-containing protein n=1 Tax=Sedimentibacter sp. TaxID=1960295 RepID=UPI00289DAD93|nr:LytTR family DNA-binding domain-containing protein [Sedimentibacter sp.]
MLRKTLEQTRFVVHEELKQGIVKEQKQMDYPCDGVIYTPQQAGVTIDVLKNTIIALLYWSSIMLKILLYGSAREREILEEALQKVLKKNEISFNFRYLSNPQQLMKNYLFNRNYRLIVACMNGSTSYVIKGDNNKPGSYVVKGTMSFPPTPEEIDEKLMRNPELASFYSSGEYTVTHRGLTRKIPYEEIDYIKRDNNTTIIHLTNGDKEIISKNIGKVNTEINRKYFVKCCIGVIVNTRNIHKIHRSGNDTRIIEFKSGSKVIMTRGYFDKFLKAYSMSVSRLADLKTLDD